jgi:putative methyltransferase (TIGR04325 family)
VELWSPPIALQLVRQWRARASLDGPFGSWEAAEAAASGWETPRLDELALSAGLRVRDGEAAFESNSRTYDRIVYSPAILAALIMATARYPGLRVMDVGGGLGSNYYQNLKLVRALPSGPVIWNVIERAPLARIGAERFQTDELRFHEAFEAGRLEQAALLFTGSLQYLPDAFGFLETAIHGVDVVALDQVLVSKASAHAIYVQRLDRRRFGEATLATWCFSAEALATWFEARGFTLVERFGNRPNRRIENCGLLFVRL